MISETRLAINSFFRAHRCLLDNKLLRYLVIPGVLSFIYITCMVMVGYAYFDVLSAYIQINFVPEFLQGTVSSVITTILLWIILILLMMLSYKHIILVIISPLLVLLSEKVCYFEFGKPAPDFSLKQMFRDLRRGLGINLVFLGKSLLYSCLVLPVLLLPFLGPLIFTVFIFFIQSFYSGAGVIDYSLERDKLNVRQSTSFLRKHRAAVTVLGAGFNLILFIPVVGWIFAPAYATAAAAITAELLD